MMGKIQNRYEVLGVIEVVKSNPNGDPDMGNLPRQDVVTGKGLMTDVCIKRKIRNAMDSEKVLYETGIFRDTKTEKLTKEELLKKYLDVRAFGAIVTTKGSGSITFTGPIQFAMAESVKPIEPVEMCIGASSVQNKKDANGETHTLGRKSVIPHAVYVFKGYVSPALANKTNLTEEDLKEVIEAIQGMFVNDKSAARPSMHLRKLYVFKHDTKLGNAPSVKVFNTVKISSLEKPTKWEDYKIEVGTPPDGVSITEYEGLE